MRISKKLTTSVAVAAIGLTAMAVADIGPFSSLGLFTQTNIGHAPSDEVTLELLAADGKALQSIKVNGVTRIGSSQVRLKVTSAKRGKIEYRLGGVQVGDILDFNTSTVNKNIDLSSIENLSPATTVGAVIFGIKNSANLIVEEKIEVDTEGPLLLSAEFVGDPTSESFALRLRFQQDDFHENSTSNIANFSLQRIVNGVPADENILVKTADREATVKKVESDIVISIKGAFEAGEYKLTVKEEFLDRIENPAGRINSKKEREEQSTVVSVVVYGPAGPAVDFPQFTTRRQTDRRTDFNPGNHVETRVVRLYYNRDAHRVAQIVNRDIRQLNKSGVQDARRIAEFARTQADSARTKRDKSERQATAVAKEKRLLERQLDVAQNKVEAAIQREKQINQIQDQLDDLGPPSGISVASLIDVPFSNIEQATISEATISNATIQQSSISGGNPDVNDVQTRTGGVLIGGGLTFGGFSAGAISWTKDETIFRGTITAGDLTPSNASPAKITGGTIDGKTTNGTTTQTGVTNAQTAATTVTRALVRNANLVNVIVTELTEETVNPNQAQIVRLNRQLERLGVQKTAATGVSATPLKSPLEKAQDEVKEIQTKLAGQDRLITEAKERVADADRVEQLANRHQFETEVAAGTEDPDSYVPADLNSIDPVMQVSISVIGEGVIQLRGPINGINEIRKIINQIDSPLGQVKVGLFTLQINGEKGDQMDEVASRMEGHIDLSRFLTNQSLQLLRRAIQEEAGRIVSVVDYQHQNLHRQIDRDRKYVYAFFGRDFIDELYEMDSEFLRTENKLLSLHAMDTVSLSQATFILALAKNDVRQRILANFLHLVRTELPESEYDQRRTTGMLKKSRDISAFRRFIRIPGLPHNPDPKLAPYSQTEFRKYCKKACELYKFQNFRKFFTANIPSSDAMTPVQRQFIRLSQIFKSKMLAEIELKQRIVERALIQDYASDEKERETARSQHSAAVRALQNSRRDRARGELKVNLIINETLIRRIQELREANLTMKDEQDALGATDLINFLGELRSKHALLSPKTINVISGDREKNFTFTIYKNEDVNRPKPKEYTTHEQRLQRCDDEKDVTALFESGFRVKVQINGKIDTKNIELKRFLSSLLIMAQSKLPIFDNYELSQHNKKTLELEECYLRKLPVLISRINGAETLDTIAKACKVIHYFHAISDQVLLEADLLKSKIDDLLILLKTSNFEGDSDAVSLRKISAAYAALKTAVQSKVKRKLRSETTAMFVRIEKELDGLQRSVFLAMTASLDEKSSRVDLDHKKLLDYLIDEKEEKYIELVEGTRSHIAHIDNYLKRLTIALEDDFKVQFYDPAFAGVRAEGRDPAVSFGQIERTVILTNNRTFAKVSPQASMEFDLPRRAPVIVEAMAGAKAIMQDYGSLVNDSTFMGITGALSGAPGVGGAPTTGASAVRPLYPTLGTDRQSSFLSGGPPGTPGGRKKTALEQLIPDPSVYKIQTGTGFEIRPVIQPDGHSLMYDFNYLYTTNVREPVDPDEKHLGRIKQHYIHTQVQTSSYELREISRYQVALKVSRTSRGVPFLEEIPIAGRLFKPAPSEESSLQQNIILGQTTVYPTLFDLMGLRWSKHVADLDHRNLRDLEHVVRGRSKSINDYVFDRASSQVDKFLDIENRSKENHRPDLYHQQSRPSPYHPNGYVYPDAENDPTGRNYVIRDRRPEEFRAEPFDDLRGGPTRHYQVGPERIDERSRYDRRSIERSEQPQYRSTPERIDGNTPIRGSGDVPRSNRRDHERIDQNTPVGRRGVSLPAPEGGPPSAPLFPPRQAQSAIELMSHERTAPSSRVASVDDESRRPRIMIPAPEAKPAKPAKKKSFLQRVFRR
jgi:hypothetical protein